MKKLFILSILFSLTGFCALLPLQFAHAQNTPASVVNGKPNTIDEATITAPGSGWTITPQGTYKDAAGDTATCATFSGYDASESGILPQNTGCTVTYADGSQASSITTTQGSGAGVVSSGALNSSGQLVASNIAAVPPSPSGNTCNLLQLGSWGNCIAGGVAVVALGFLGLAGFLLGLVGSLFNWIVVITVFQFGSYFGNSTGLLTAWGILRDMGNIMLLFGFILMGVMIILT